MHSLRLITKKNDNRQNKFSLVESILVKFITKCLFSHYDLQKDGRIYTPINHDINTFLKFRS